MTTPSGPADNTSHEPDLARMAADDETSYGGVLGGDADARMDAGGPEDGAPGRGADGDTAAREQLRVDLGKRSPDADRES